MIGVHLFFFFSLHCGRVFKFFAGAMIDNGFDNDGRTPAVERLDADFNLIDVHLS